MANEAPSDAFSAVVEAPSLIDLLPAMAWTATADARIQFVNQQCCAFTSWTRERLLGSGLLACLHPDEPGAADQLRSHLLGSEPFEAQIRLRRYDGCYIRCRVRAVPLRAGGQVVKWLGTFIEANEPHAAGAEHELREQHLELALESADVGIWRLKLPSFELTVDERTRRHLDLESYVIQDYNPDAYIHPDDFVNSASQSEDVDGRCSAVHRVRQRDGTYRWQAIRWRRWWQHVDPTGLPTLITGTSMDVTAGKEAEAARAELDQRYRIALEAAGLGTWSSTLEQRTMHLDDRARLHLGVSQPTLTFEESLQRIHELDRERTVQELQRQILDPAQRNRVTVEFRVQHPSGETRWVSSQLHVTFDAQEPVRIIGVTRDITESKQAVEKVRRLNVELERRVQQRTAELTAANRELESFAYTVSHDLRSPLRIMRGFCEALLQDHGASLSVEARKYVQHVIEGSQRLADTIDGLLALSRSTQGALRRDFVDVSGVATRILVELSYAEPHRRVAWSVEPGLRAYGDSRMLEAVMRNLLENAWKYSAKRSDARIRVFHEIVDDDEMFCVEDNGAGFSMDDAAKLFQPFTRLHSQNGFAGLGIGLATVERIVHRHGGKVQGVGVPGGGATFRFSLPLPDGGLAGTKERK